MYKYYFGIKDIDSDIIDIQIKHVKLTAIFRRFIDECAKIFPDEEVFRSKQKQLHEEINIDLSDFEKFLDRNQERGRISSSDRARFIKAIKEGKDHDVSNGVNLLKDHYGTLKQFTARYGKKGDISEAGMEERNRLFNRLTDFQSAKCTFPELNLGFINNLVKNKLASLKNNYDCSGPLSRKNLREVVSDLSSDVRDNRDSFYLKEAFIKRSDALLKSIEKSPHLPDEKRDLLSLLDSALQFNGYDVKTGLLHDVTPVIVGNSYEKHWVNNLDSFGDDEVSLNSPEHYVTAYFCEFMRGRFDSIDDARHAKNLVENVINDYYKGAFKSVNKDILKEKLESLYETVERSLENRSELSQSPLW